MRVWLQNKAKNWLAECWQQNLNYNRTKLKKDFKLIYGISYDN